ncbi:MAG: antibiotic biosynthesis monooxygenase [Desulfomonile tiedjei]|nr:antibiotic biosynthesis monooxygenase [Desulfomonile tiedjei]
MAIKVLTERKFKEGTAEAAHQLIKELRAVGTLRRGFVSGQTLISAEDPHRFLVISTWTDANGWEAWRASEKRNQIAVKIGELLEEPERVEVYYVERKEVEGADMA